MHRDILPKSGNLNARFYMYVPLCLGSTIHLHPAILFRQPLESTKAIDKQLNVLKIAKHRCFRPFRESALSHSVFILTSFADSRGNAAARERPASNEIGLDKYEVQSYESCDRFLLITLTEYAELLDFRYVLHKTDRCVARSPAKEKAAPWVMPSIRII